MFGKSHNARKNTCDCLCVEGGKNVYYYIISHDIQLIALIISYSQLMHRFSFLSLIF